MKKLLLISLVMYIFWTPVSAMKPTNLSLDIIKTAEKDCSSFNHGQFNAENAFILHDLTGDGIPEEIIDGSKFSCSTALTLWGGTGGTFLWVIVDGKAHEFLAHRWWVANLEQQNVLLLAVHSSQCGENIGPCYRALVWQDGFRTTTR